MSSADRRSGEPSLVVSGVDGVIARALLRTLRDARPGQVDSTLRIARPDRRASITAGSAVPDAAAPGGHPGDPRSGAAEPGHADTVVFIALSTDLASDLARGHQRRRQGLREMTAAAMAQVRAGGHLVVVTSARVYGAAPDNPVPLPEDSERCAGADGSITGDLLLVESEVAALARNRPDVRVTLVRPAAVVGAGVDTTITRHFETPRLLVVHGSDPVWQFCHVDDLADAVRTVVDLGLGPIVTVGSAGWLSQRQVEQISGKRRVELPVGVVTATATRLHAVGVLSDPGGDLDYVRYPWVVPATRLREHGWAPTFDNETCLGVLLDGIRSERALLASRRDTAVGTASAAVALVGTAALMRRHRRKGGRR